MTSRAAREAAETAKKLQLMLAELQVRSELKSPRYPLEETVHEAFILSMLFRILNALLFGHHMLSSGFLLSVLS